MKEDPCCRRFGSRQQVFQWHEDGIGLPPGAVHLAGSPASKVQAFRYGEHAYGLQFHLEANSSLIERWLNVPEHRDVLAEGQHEKLTDQIRAQTGGFDSDQLESLSEQTFSRWIDRFEMQPRRKTLPSR